MENKSFDKYPFNFAKNKISPETVLRKIWTLIQQRLSPVVVAHLTSIFVSEGIFIPRETFDCCTSQNFLQLLDTRDDQQTAKAINIICSEPIYQEIREKVGEHFTHQLESESGGSMSGTPQNGTSSGSDDIIISPGTQIDTILEALLKDSGWSAQWVTLSHNLGLNDTFLDPLTTMWRMCGIEFEDLLKKIINKWVTQSGKGATLKSFCAALEKTGLILCKANVKDAFHKK